MQSNLNQHIPLQTVINKVQSMTGYNNNAKKLASKYGLAINSVTWEDCARNKGSVWGPCISDMTLEINNYCMPVIREPNYTDKTWDVRMDKVPVVIGNEKEIPGNKLKTISLTEYLKNFQNYMTNAPNIMNNPQLNLLRTSVEHASKDSHVIMSSQCCFLPIEKGKQTKFNVALYHYQSSRNNPAVLVIVSTSKGSSAQIIQGNKQKLLFNNYGRKADFIGQRLTDNRIERGVSIHGAMTKQEKQDNCIVIIQVPLKQKEKYPNYNPYPYPVYFGGGGVGGGYYNNNNSNNINNNNNYNDALFGSVPQSAMMNTNMNMNYNFMQAQQQEMQEMAYLQSNQINYNNNNNNNNSNYLHKKKRSSNANVEAAIIKVSPKTQPICKCGDALEKYQVQYTYEKPNVNCDGCGKSVTNLTDIIYHCKKKGNDYRHKHGYDLCLECGDKQLKFDELDGLNHSKLKRDERYPIRVTLQYYKSTDNGIVNNDIMNAIKQLLVKSQKQSDFIGSLVTDPKYIQRKTDFVEEKKNNNNDIWVDNIINNVNNNNNKKGFEKIKKALQNFCGNNWEEYYNNFLNEEVNDTDVLSLSDTDLAQLIPKMGPRSRIRKWIDQRKQNESDTNFLDGIL